MSFDFIRGGAAAALLSGLLLGAVSAPAQAQDATMKQCGEKWQAAKAAGTTSGTTWPKFLSECRSGGATAAATDAKPAATPAKVEAPAVAKPAVVKPAATAAGTEAPKAAAPQPTGNIVFPTAVSPKFSTLSAGRARQKTCSEQYQANKGNNANGGLKWLEKGGGYWSLCNSKLKG
jgi:hypothetical protein